jgi:AbrB family looped-hinge helix DNA binding protein
MLATLDKFGRILIPKKVREHLGIRPASALHIKDDGKRIIIEPIKEEEPIVEKDGLLIFTGKVQSNLEQELKLNRNQRMKNLFYPGE